MIHAQPTRHYSQIIERWLGRAFRVAEVAVAVALILLGARYVFDAIGPDRLPGEVGGTVTGRTLGHVKRTAGDARWRSRSGFAWRDFGNAVLPVAEGDRLFTGDVGRASVTFLRGTVLHIRPGSLVVIAESAKSDRTPTLEIKQGKVSIQVNPDSPIALRWQGNEYKIEGGSSSGKIELQNVHDRNGTERLVTRSAQDFKLIRPDAPAVHVNSNQPTALNTAGKAVPFVAPVEVQANPRPFALAGPVSGYLVVAENDEKPAQVTLSWPAPTVGTVAEYEVEIRSQDSSIRTQRTRLQALSVPLTAGTYQWRARARLLDGSLMPWSEERSLQIALKAARAKVTRSVTLIQPMVSVVERPKPVEPRPPPTRQFVESPSPPVERKIAIAGPVPVAVLAPPVETANLAPAPCGV